MNKTTQLPKKLTFGSKQLKEVVQIDVQKNKEKMKELDHRIKQWCKG